MWIIALYQRLFKLCFGGEMTNRIFLVICSALMMGASCRKKQPETTPKGVETIEVAEPEVELKDGDFRKPKVPEVKIDYKEQIKKATSIKF